MNGSFHTADGDPIVDTEKFPSLSAMVTKAHTLGLHGGFYMNNCGCNEHEFTDPEMIAKVTITHRMTFCCVVVYIIDRVLKVVH